MVHRPPQGNDGRQLLYDPDHLEPYLPAEKQDLSPVMDPTVVKAMAMTHGRNEVQVMAGTKARAVAEAVTMAQAVAGQRVTEIKRVPLVTVTKTMRGKSMALEAHPLMARGPMKSKSKSSSGRR